MWLLEELLFEVKLCCKSVSHSLFVKEKNHINRKHLELFLGLKCIDVTGYITEIELCTLRSVGFHSKS